MENSAHSPASSDLTTISRAYRLRQLKDRLTTWGMGIGGISVIIAIILIFFYLLVVVFPLFVPADMQAITQYAQVEEDKGKTLHLAIEEQNELAVRITDKGEVIFFHLADGSISDSQTLPVESARTLSSFTTDRLAKGFFAFGMDNGSLLVARHKYDLSYDEQQNKTVNPSLVFPFGETPVVIDEDEQALQHIAIKLDEENGTIASFTEDGRLLLTRLEFDSELSELDDDDDTLSFEATTASVSGVPDAQQLLINYDQRLLYVVHNQADITLVDISDIEEPVVLGRKRVVAEDARLSRVSFLTGEISLLIGDDHGRISQWFPVNRAGNIELTHIRSFDTRHGKISDIVTEQRRKGFAAVDEKGQVAIYSSTARRTVLQDRITDQPIAYLAVSPRANTLLAEARDGKLHFWHMENEHPEISWSVLWEKVWYESYPEPSYTWQSSSASNDFEPKFSLTPLAFGTMKAAFYAMMFAVPLAIMGAIFTAYFMSPTMRGYVKPTIEIMEALPTVILGFLAGLWLAPVIETHLVGVFSALIVLPAATLLFGLLWQYLPRHIRNRVPDGWQAALLIPVLLIAGWLALSLSLPLEHLLFDGDMRQWMNTELGIGFDQRNSLVVGIAMGVAVIPTIFSITEDAIFSVPKHLTLGSLALGATPWQTLVRVVILTASPGIFSAVMIGLGRAVGETMIVLMATGNTPVMDFSIFQGMRTLSANIAVEMPESEVASTHYRVLFLAALVLFMFTFFFNTLAELIRQRLRKKYSSL